MGKPNRGGDGSTPSQQTGNEPITSGSGKTAAGSGGAYDFADNQDSLQVVIDDLVLAQKELNQSIDSIYGLLTGKLNQSWSGTVYTAFMNRCNFYRPALEELITLIGAFEKMFNEVKSEAGNLNDEVGSALSNI
jgi:hypothetical protein